MSDMEIPHPKLWKSWNSCKIQQNGIWFTNSIEVLDTYDLVNFYLILLQQFTYMCDLWALRWHSRSNSNMYSYRAVYIIYLLFYCYTEHYEEMYHGTIAWLKAIHQCNIDTLGPLLEKKRLMVLLRDWQWLRGRTKIYMLFYFRLTLT